MNYRFHVMSLREHIKRENRVKRISASKNLAEITRQRGGIARDITDSLWFKLQDSANDPRLSAGARRIEQNEISLECAG